MELFEVIKERRSVRAFLDSPVEEEKIGKLLDAARWAPSAGNVQPWEFIVVKKEDTRKKLANAALGQRFIAQAPVVIVACANPERSKRRYGYRGEFYSQLDTAAAVQNLLLAAHSLGLASCWVGAFNEDEVKELLKIPEHVKVIAILPIGYPAEKPSPPHRFEINQIVYPEEYGAELKERRELRKKRVIW